MDATETETRIVVVVDWRGPPVAYLRGTERWIERKTQELRQSISWV